MAHQLVLSCRPREGRGVPSRLEPQVIAGCGRTGPEKMKLMKTSSLNKTPLETHFKNKEELALWPLTLLPIQGDHSESHQVFDLKGNWAGRCLTLIFMTRDFQSEKLCVQD